MARMPDVQWRPLPRGFGTRMTRYDLVLVHTCVGSFEGTDGYFRSGKTASNSHFLTGGYGEIRQLGDTAFRSAANADGNHRSITIENADMGPGFAAWNTRDGGAVPAFTPQQVEANARICAWAHLAHGVPLAAADTSRPNARGVGFHRLGCDPYRVPDGERWSSAYGKVCPGPRRIAQIPQIIARAIEIVNGDDMPTAQEVADAVVARLLQANNRTVGDTLLNIEQAVSDNQWSPVSTAVWNRPIAPGATPEDPVRAWQMLLALDGTLRGLTALVAQQNGLTLDEVRRVVSEEVAKVVQVDVAVTGGDPTAT